MPVISMVSSKGGAGKTTAALVLAGELSAAARSVVLIDADPNQPLVFWSELEGRPPTIDVVADQSADTILNNIEQAQARADFVIVDLEGTANNRISFAVSQSDLVLIPVQGSVLDAQEAAKSIKLIKQMSQVANREIPYAVFFSRVPAAIREKTLRDIEEQFAAGGVTVLKSSLVDRAAYRSMFSYGGTLHTLQLNQVSGLGGARSNAAFYAQAVLNELKKGAGS